LGRTQAASSERFAGGEARLSDPAGATSSYCADNVTSPASIEIS